MKKITLIILSFFVLGGLLKYETNSLHAENGNQSSESKESFYKKGKLLYDQKKYSEAFPFLERAAKMGHSDAQMHLGKMYYNGWGVKHNHKLAEEWHKKAAAQGNKESIEKLKKFNNHALNKPGPCGPVYDGKAELNKAAPDFTLPSDEGNSYVLSENLGKNLLLVFYPGDNTPVCTAQLCDYRDGLQEFKNLGIDVIGISHNDIKSHREFKKKYNLPFTLLSDTQYCAAEKYNAAGLLGMKRAIFLIDKNGIIRFKHEEFLSIFRMKRSDLLAAVKLLG